MLVCSMEDMQLEGCKGNREGGFVPLAKMGDGRMEILHVMLLGEKLHSCSHQSNQKSWP